ncbi:MAG: RNA export factor gle2 [Trizodia sp. TS-e1964]|nr:MAG: RNA export factor gle2 [Trizodia sp. TS-e1964]
MAGLFPTATATAAANAATGDLSKDIEVKDPPDDSISDISFCPQAELLAVGSWDNKVRIYEISSTGTSTGRALFDFEGPVLSVDWSPDGTKVVGAGADKTARVLDISAGGNTAQMVGRHEQPIRCARFVSMPNVAGPMLVTGSWDKTVKYWDMRQAEPAGTVPCQERIYSMDTRDSLLVVGTADRYINVINLASPMEFYKTMQSPLKWQTRVISCFTKADGFAVGSIEGRCAIQYVEESKSSANFSFKCHRETPPNQRDISNVYSVNAISFHPVHGTFSTAGSDGTFHFWDKDAKHRLKGYPNTGGMISATAFSRTGNIFAYAISYDWSKGYAFNHQSLKNKIMLHAVVGDECKPRPVVQKKTR